MSEQEPFRDPPALNSPPSVVWLGCPHCGSEDLEGPHFNDYTGDTYDPHWWIECKHCPCGMQVNGETFEPLRQAWNKRTFAAKPYLDLDHLYEDD